MAKRVSKKEYAKQKQAELKETVGSAMDQIRGYTKDPEDIKDYLKFMSSMYDYTPRNQMLLDKQYQGSVMSKTGFTGVASKKDFNDQGFTVHEEDKPLKVMAPVFKKFVEDDNGKFKPFQKLSKEDKERANNGELKVDSKLHYYQFVDVYDIRQTDAKPEDYPKLFPNRPYSFDDTQLNEKYPHLKTAIENVADDKGIKVKELTQTNTMGSAKGAYVPATNEVYMKPHLTNPEYIQTLTHELAHGKLHQKSSLDTPTKELEAEMTAYVTNQHFGLDTSEKSINYMANWTDNLNKHDEKETIQVVERVSKASREMINDIEQEYGNIKEKTLERENNIDTNSESIQSSVPHDKEQKEENNKDILAIEIDGVKLDFDDLKDQKVKDVDLLQDSESLSINHKGKQLHAYDNEISKVHFNQHGHVNDISQSNVTVEDYVNLAVERSQGVAMEDYSINEKLSKPNKKQKQEQLNI